MAAFSFLSTLPYFYEVPLSKPNSFSPAGLIQLCCGCHFNVNMLICALWDSLGQTCGVFFPFWNKLLYRVPGVCSQCCALMRGGCLLCAGDRELLLLFCFLALSPPQFLPLCWAVLLFWTGQPCHYLILEFSVCGDCIDYPYGQMADSIRL